MAKKLLSKTRPVADSRWRVFYKDGHSSMLLFQGLTYINAQIRVNRLSFMYDDWVGKFIITH